MLQKSEISSGSYDPVGSKPWALSICLEKPVVPVGKEEYLWRYSFFPKNFQWKGPFHLISHRNDRFFQTNGKRPLINYPIVQRHSQFQPIRFGGNVIVVNCHTIYPVEVRCSFYFQPKFPVKRSGEEVNSNWGHSQYWMARRNGLGTHTDLKWHQKLLAQSDLLVCAQV